MSNLSNFISKNVLSDYDECSDRTLHGCEQNCTNTVGSYLCSCPKGDVPLQQDNRTCTGNILLLIVLTYYVPDWYLHITLHTYIPDLYLHITYQTVTYILHTRRVLT